MLLNKFLIRVAACSLACFLAIFAGCTSEKPYPNRPITLVCPWAAGGGTDRVSRQMAIHLEQDLGVPVNVINATGGKGVTGHNRGLSARPDGYTLAMITLELNMMHWMGLTDLTYEVCAPLMSVNEDYAAVFVRNDAPWQTISELENEIRKRPGELQASGTASGGAWHLALAGWLLAAELDVNDVVWIPNTGAGPSLQELMSGGFDLVCCSLPEADALLKSGEVRAIGVMAPDRAKGYEDVPTFAENGREWSLGGWRGLAVAKGTPPEIVAKLEAAIERVVTGKTKVQTATGKQTFPEFMVQQKFNNTWRPSGEFRKFLADADKKFGKLLTSPAMADVIKDDFSPMTYPYIVMSLIGLTGIGIVVQSRVGRDSRAAARVDERAVAGLPTELPTAGRPSLHGVGYFMAIVGGIVAYLLFAETAGYLITMCVVLGVMLIWLRTPIVWSGLIVLGFVPGVYFLFSSVLRVPLPQGFLGW